MAAGVPALPLQLDPLIGEAKAHARRRRFRVAALVALVGIAIALGLELRSAPGGVPAARTVRAAGIRVHLPQGWYVTQRLLDDVSWPIQRFVVSSYPVTFDASKADSEYLPSQRGVLAQIVEEYPPLHGEHWPPRPARLRLGRLSKMKLFGGDRWSERIFRSNGRHIYVFAWVGRDASASAKHQLLTILDGMRITSAP